MKVRDAIMLVLFLSVLVLPMTMYGVQSLVRLEMPSWLTAEDAINLSGSKNDVEVMANATPYGFKNGEFQAALESEIENFIPCKASVLLANAALQRNAIILSNSLFDWEWYPTFYGSDIVSNKQDDLLVTPIVKQSDAVAEGLESTAMLYNELMANHPDIEFYFAMPSSGSSSMLTNDLFHDAVDQQYLDKHFFDLLDERMSIVDLAVDDLDEYRELYFKTDHHWKMTGGYRGYRLIAERMGFGDDILPMGAAMGFDVAFYGSEARLGLDTDTGPDDLVDYRFDLPDFDVYFGWDQVQEQDPADFVASEETYKNGEEKDAPFENHYAWYYHIDHDIFKLQSRIEEPSDEALLIAADSFSNNMERLFLNNFDTVYSYSCKRYNKGNLSNVVDGFDDVRTVLILQSFSNIAEWS